MDTAKHWWRWLAAWPGMMVLALLNGTLRAVVVQPWLGEEVARRLASMVLVVAIAGYVWWLHRRLPLPSSRLAWGVGWSWLALTLAFEFGFGRFVEGLAWSTMLADYDITRGRLWVLVPVCVTVAPAVVRLLQNRRGTPEPVASARAHGS